ncbi:MAG: hypothetical protein ACE5JM_00040 [Armatimonadota bacterium]
MMDRKRCGPVWLLGLLMAAIALMPGVRSTFPGLQAADGGRGPYRSPFDVAYSPDGKMLAVSDYTAAAVVLIDVGEAKVRGEVELRGNPAGVVWAPDGKRLFVAECGAGSVAEVDPGAGKVTRRLAVGPRPIGLALAPKRGVLLAANSATDSVSVVDLRSGKQRRRIAGPHAPYFVAVTPDEKLAVVSNLLPATPASDAGTSASVSLIDIDAGVVAADVRVPPNGAVIREVAITSDGKWAYAAHTFGRATLPTTQLERGWINTNAVTVIDLTQRERLVTVLLDQVSQGAANPWGVAVSEDGGRLWVSLSGVHQIAKVDVAGLHTLLQGETPEYVQPQDLEDTGYRSTWVEIREDPSKRELLANDLSALYRARLLARTPVEGNGPRGVDISPDGKQLAVAMYYTGSVALVDAESGATTKTISVGPSPEPDDARRGETIFNDATYCFQHWLSCSTCHPEGRADGLNWDLLNDDIGNPKNARSLLLSHKTPPMMSRGIRDNVEVAAAAGFRHILFREPEEGEVEAVVAYLRAMQPEKSPYLSPKGQLTAKAKRGKALFDSKQVGCAECHPAPLYTDLKMWDVGTRGELDRVDAFDTPTLIEIWRTPPYLHDGQATSLREVLTTHNKDDKHGKVSNLSKREIDALVEYLLSL